MDKQKKKIKNYRIKTRKFTDERFLKYYNRGFSDIHISKIFGCGASTIFKRRYKLGLVANFPNFAGKRNSKKEVEEQHKIHLERIRLCAERNKEQNKNQRKNYIRNYYLNNQEKIRKYQKEYRKNNKEKIRKYYEKSKNK